MIHKFLIFGFLVLGSAAFLAFEQTKELGAISPFLLRRAERQVKIRLADQVVTAEAVVSRAARAKGLSGRPSLAPHTGMLFVFETPGRYGFWMKDMKFPIDIVWIEGGRVVDIVEKAPPDDRPTRPVYYPRRPASRVLELPAGFSEKYGLKIGDMVEMTTAAGLTK